jgi:asparagine synthase (glutamine-hydrolysing)
MCGICGVILKQPEAQVSARLLETMNDVMIHRGPDDSGQARFGSVGLAMRRLSIIDLAGGHQPIYNEDRTHSIVFNGEIYNHRELRRELEARGHRFSTRTDTEVILHGYEEWGADCVQRLNGMFAFAIWDANSETLFLARDPVGIKPLYLYEDPGRLLFASEMKALLAAGNVPREVDPVALHHYLTFLYVPPPRTMLRGVSKLPPGHWARWKDGRLEIQEYWAGPAAHFGPEPTEPVSTKAVLDQLTAAVRRHLLSDVPVGCLLSGGIDSSLIAALMARELGPGFSTFTAGFPGAGIYDERTHARAVASHVGSKHLEVEVTSESVDLLERIVRHLDEPLADASVIPNYVVAELAGANVKVVLSGVGGDETFGGYRRYYAHHLAGRWQRCPAGVRRVLIRAASRVVPVGGNTRLGNAVRLAQKLFDHLDDAPERRYLAWNAFFSEEAKQRLYADGKGNHLPDSLADSQQWLDRMPNGDLTRRAMFVDIKTYLPGDPLLLADKLSMAHSLELRVPFLDRGLVEFAARIPARQHGNRLATKQLLREAAKDLLPASILHRPKQGFGTPIDLWLRKELKPLLMEALSHERLRARGWFDPKTVASLVDEHLGGRRDLSQELWALLVFELWQQQFVDQIPETAVTQPQVALA